MCHAMDSDESGHSGINCQNMNKPPSRRRGVQTQEMSAEELVQVFGTPMHAAAILGTSGDIAALSAAGHEVSGRDQAGRTPCHLAAISGNLKNLQALVSVGAQLEVPPDPPRSARGAARETCACSTGADQTASADLAEAVCEEGRAQKGQRTGIRSACDVLRSTAIASCVLGMQLARVLTQFWPGGGLSR
jgi:ankyrin repeat protein